MYLCNSIFVLCCPWCEHLGELVDRHGGHGFPFVCYNILVSPCVTVRKLEVLLRIN